MGTQAGTEHASDLQELGDPEFFSHWATLRHRIALSGKPVPCSLKHKYAAVSAEYRRRTDGGDDE
jgi:hypothetical protein